MIIEVKQRLNNSETEEPRMKQKWNRGNTDETREDK